MANFTNTFTGKGTSTPLPSGAGLQRAQEGMSNLILSADKLKYDTYQANEKEFLKNANVDPVFVLSNSARETQTKLLDTFNTKWGKTMKDRGGNLSTDDKMQMAKEKDFILMNQQKMQSDLQRAMIDRDAISKDVQGNLDHEDFQAKWNNFISTGDYDPSPLMPSAINPDQYFSQDIHKGNFGRTSVSVTKKNPDGTLSTVKQMASGTEAQGRDLIAAHMHSNDRMARGFIQGFQQLKTTDPVKYKEYLEGSDNPILKWAQDNYWDKALKLEEDTSQRPQTTTGNGIKINLFGRDVSFAPGRERTGTIPYGDKTYVDPIEFDGTFKLANIPTTGGSLLRGTTSRPINSKGNIEGYLKNYDKDRDVLIVAATGTDPNIDNGTLVEIPASNLNQAEINKIPIVVNGQQTTLGAIRGTKSPVTTKKKAY